MNSENKCLPKPTLARVFHILSGEFWLTCFANHRNSGGMIFARAVWVSVLCTLAIVLGRLLCVANDGWCTPGRVSPLPNSSCDWIGFARHEVGHIFNAYGSVLLAAFAGSYTALYARFASQWEYLADLYNQIKAKQIDVAVSDVRDELHALRQKVIENPNQPPDDHFCNAAYLLAQWKAGFIEDAEKLHLAEKPPFAAVVSNWKSDAVVQIALRHSLMQSRSHTMNERA